MRALYAAHAASLMRHAIWRTRVRRDRCRAASAYAALLLRVRCRATQYAARCQRYTREGATYGVWWRRLRYGMAGATRVPYTRTADMRHRHDIFFDILLYMLSLLSQLIYYAKRYYISLSC